MTESKQKPVKKFRSGTVSAAVWENVIQTENGYKTVQNITFQRGYRDETNQWKNTDSFTTASLGNLLAVVLQAVVSCNAEKSNDIS